MKREPIELAGQIMAAFTIIGFSASGLESAIRADDKLIVKSEIDRIKRQSVEIFICAEELLDALG